MTEPLTDVDRLYAKRWPNGRKPWPLAESQLNWCRKTWPKFKKWEAGARRVLTETDASHARYGTWPHAVAAATRGDLRPLGEFEMDGPGHE